MTDETPAKAPVTKATATKAGAAKATAAKVPAAKSAAAKTPAAKTATTRTPATKTPTTKTTAARTPAATRPARAAAATKTPVASVVPPAPVVPVVVAPVAAAAPAGWYPVAGTSQQRWWDGVNWTEHTYDPTTAAAGAVTARANAAPVKAPEGTNPNTAWFWITALTPVIAIVGLVPTVIYFNALGNVDFTDPSQLTGIETSPAYIASTLLGLLEVAAYILFPILDWRALGKRGVPRPFHWAWSLVAIAISTPIVYVIGRSVVVKRRTGAGLAPLWVFVGVQLVSWIAGLVVFVAIASALLTQFGNLLSSAGNVL